MRAVLFFPKLDLYSGAAQLIRMQVRGLRAAGTQARVACERGAVRFFLSTGIRTHRAEAHVVATRARRSGDILVDHGLAIASADVVFVHNLATEANRYLGREDRARAERERAFFAALGSRTPVVANSALVRDALCGHFGLSAERVLVRLPGYQSARFSADRKLQARRQARRALGLSEATPLVGYVTSGDFHKRGLDLFLEVAEEVAARLPDARFLIVGSRRLPADLGRHSLFSSGRAIYRPKNHRPEVWIGALDLFLYPARYEEFGMVVLESMALGVPVLTSRRVGAAEVLPAVYADWVAVEPSAGWFAERALRLLGDETMRTALASAGEAWALRYTDERYGAACAETILKSRGSSTD